LFFKTRKKITQKQKKGSMKHIETIGSIIQPHFLWRVSDPLDTPFLNKTEQFSTLKNIKEPKKALFPLQRQIITRKPINISSINKDGQQSTNCLLK
jgi:hypothetical protein